MLVMIDPPRLELLARFGLDHLLIHRNLLGDIHAKQQQFGRIKLLRARSVKPPENRIHLCLVTQFHRLDALGGFAFDLLNRGIPSSTFSNQRLLEQRRIIGKLFHI